MDDLLSFVSKKVKQTSGLTMRELVSSSGMTKSMFYRYMQEPWRLSKEQMKNIENYLQLSGEDKETIDQFFLQHDNKRQQYGKQFLNQLLFNSWPVEKDFQSKLYTLFDTTAQKGKISRLSSKEFVETFRQWIDCLGLPPTGHFLNISIINCLCSEKIKLLYSILLLLQKMDIFSNYNSLIRHTIDSSNMSSEDKLRSIRTTNSLYTLFNYSVEYVPLEESMWSNTDFFLAEYSHNNQQKLIITMIFPTNTDALIYFSTDRLLFDYLTYNSEKIFRFETKSTYAPNEPLGLNRFLTQTLLTHPKILIAEELCYDCFCTELWEETKEYFKQNDEMIPELRKFGDPRNELSPFSNVQFVEYVFDSFLQRYMASELHRVINLISPSGLKRLATKGAIKDFDYFHFRLTEAQVLRELQNIRERLGDHRSEKKLSYLILNPTCRMNYYALVIFRDYFFMYYAGEYASSNALSSGGTQQADISTMLYDYIVDEILPNDRRKTFDSPVMSDEQATEFVDSLIDSVKTRMYTK